MFLTPMHLAVLSLTIWKEQRSVRHLDILSQRPGDRLPKDCGSAARVLNVLCSNHGTREPYLDCQPISPNHSTGLYQLNALGRVKHAELSRVRERSLVAV